MKKTNLGKLLMTVLIAGQALPFTPQLATGQAHDVHPLAPASPSAEWVWSPTAKKWWMRYADGSYPFACVIELWNGVDAYDWFGFDDDGWLVYNRWMEQDGKWYWIGNTGTAAKGWACVGDKWYFFNNDRIMQTGLIYDGGKAYVLDPSGAMARGWRLVDGKWYYLTSDGSAARGWLLIDGVWYFFRDDGVMTTGWQLYNGSYYHLADSGAMDTGWIYDGNFWYYFFPSGENARSTTVGEYSFDDQGRWIEPGGILDPASYKGTWKGTLVNAAKSSENDLPCNYGFTHPITFELDVVDGKAVLVDGTLAIHAHGAVSDPDATHSGDMEIDLKPYADQFVFDPTASTEIWYAALEVSNMQGSMKLLLNNTLDGSLYAMVVTDEFNAKSGDFFHLELAGPKG